MPPGDSFGAMRNLIGVIFAMGALAPVLGAQGTIPGFYKETHATSRYVGERAAAMPAPRDRTEREWQAGGATRLEGRVMALTTSPDAFFLMRAGATTSYQVIPSERTIRTISLVDVPAEYRNAAASASSTTFKDLGDGGVILGHRTRKFETRVTMTLPPTAGRRGAAERFTTTSISWIATDPSDPMVAAWVLANPAPAGAAKARPRGVVLRSESHTEGMLPADRVSRTEVTVWRREQVDTARFSLPAGYRRISMNDEMKAQLAKVAASRALLDEVKRLRASSKPADQRRLKLLTDSMLQSFRGTMDTLRLQQRLRSDPNAVRITDTVPARRKP